MQPLVVCDTAHDAAAALSELCEAGWHAVATLPDEPWSLAPRRLVYHGDAVREDVAQEGLLAGVRGAAVVLVAPPDGIAAARLVEDLSRLGPVRLVADHPNALGLTLEHNRLLDLLAAGTSIAAAARLLNLSRRTAHRRLREAQILLGVGSTAEAVACSRDGEAQGGPGLPIGLNGPPGDHGT